MDEIVEEIAETEVAPPDTSVNEEIASETRVIQEQQEVQEKNWKAMRERQENLDLELKKKNELIEKLLNQQLSQSQPQKKEEEPEDPDEDFIPKGKVKNLAKKVVEPLEAKILELERKIESRRKADSFDYLKKTYPDFEEVVNPDSLAMLEETKPALAKALAAYTDPIEMGKDVYDYLKAIRNPEAVAKKQHVKEVEKKLAKNEKTVQSPLAYDKRPMAQAFKTPSKEERDAIYNEMMGYASLASTVPEMH